MGIDVMRSIDQIVKKEGEIGAHSTDVIVSVLMYDEKVSAAVTINCMIVPNETQLAHKETSLEVVCHNHI